MKYIIVSSNVDHTKWNGVFRHMLTVQTGPIIYLKAHVHPSDGYNYRIYVP